MKIIVTYRSIDGFRQTRSFKTLTGARKFAVEMVGATPEIACGYAMAGDSVGKITATGCALSELFPTEGSAPVEEIAPARRSFLGVSNWTDADPLEAIFGEFIRQEAGLPAGM